MIHATFGLSETGSVRSRNEDSYLIDTKAGILAVADGLGGLPNGKRASRISLEILRQKLLRTPDIPLLDLLLDVNNEARNIGFELDASGFGTTLTMVRILPFEGKLELAHVGDSAAYLLRGGAVRMLTEEHTVAANMVAAQYEEASEAIPPGAHHTLTQCIGQDLFIDPQICSVNIRKGDRLFLLTDGVNKPIEGPQLEEALLIKDSLERVCQALTFRVEIAGSPDNYTIVGAEF